MKIEDIKPGDVIVRTKDKILFKVTEVTEGEIMQLANGKMNEVFCIFQEPKPIAFWSVDEFEPSTEEQRQYLDSKLAIFNGAKSETDSKRIAAHTIMIKAEEARKFILNAIEDKNKEQLNIIAEYIDKACEKGQMKVLISNATHIFTDLDSLVNLLKMRYGYRICIKGVDLCIYWNY